MSFIGKAVKGIGQAIGIVPNDPTPAPINIPSMTAPTVSNTADTTNVAEQQAAASVSRGRTSTMLTGAQGEDETKLNTSKVLLGQ